MQKLQRNYYAEFTIEEKGEITEVITIKYPIPISMDIKLDILGNASNAFIQFTNLERTIQAKLYVDRFTEVKAKNITFNLYAGYGDTMPLIFSGTVLICTSYRSSGSVDWITEIQAFAGGNFEQYGFINTTFVRATEIKDILDYMLKDNPNLSLGCISPDLKPLQKNTTFIGQTLDLLGRAYGDYDIFIDKGRLHVLGQRDVVKGELLVITDSTGLLGVPRKSNVYVEIETVFEPRLALAQGVSLISKSPLIQELGFNQAYQVTGINHKGVISERTGGKLTTKATLAALQNEYRELEYTEPTKYESKNVSTQWEKPIKQGIGRISSPYGKRVAPLEHASTDHKGIDIAAPLNTPVYAPANGKVTLAGYDGANGNCIRIDNGHINGKHVTSVYAHLASWKVELYQNVNKGQVIGYVGSTGKYADGKPSSTAPHLHFGISEDGKPVNPINYIGNY